MARDGGSYHSATTGERERGRGREGGKEERDSGRADRQGSEGQNCEGLGRLLGQEMGGGRAEERVL